MSISVQTPLPSARPKRVPRWHSTFIVGLGLLLSLLSIAAPIPKSAPEAQVKGELLIRLAYVVAWPTNSFQSPTQPFRVGILGTDPFGEALEQTISKRKVGGRPFEILRSSSPSDLASCQIVFVPKTETKTLASILAAIRQPGVLLVGESERFCQQGGMVSLLQSGDLPMIEFHIGNTRAAALDISGHLANTQGVRFSDRGNK